MILLSGRLPDVRLEATIRGLTAMLGSERWRRRQRLSSPPSFFLLLFLIQSAVHLAAGHTSKSAESATFTTSTAGGDGWPGTDFHWGRWRNRKRMGQDNGRERAGRTDEFETGAASVRLRAEPRNLGPKSLAPMVNKNAVAHIFPPAPPSLRPFFPPSIR